MKKTRNTIEKLQNVLPVQSNVSTIISKRPKPIFTRDTLAILPRSSLNDDRHPTDLPGKFFVEKLT